MSMIAIASRHTSSHRHHLLSLVLTLVCLGTGFTLRPSPVAAVTTIYYVNPFGNDANSGFTTAAPFRTIQKALDLAQPGAVVQLAAGVYLQDVLSRRDGTTIAPITITGPSTAVIKGAGNARIVQITHDHLILRGFTIDGRWGSGSRASDYRDKLLYVQGTAPRQGVNGLKLLRMTFQNAGGECVRFRYFAVANEIAESTFMNCGVHDFTFNTGGKNGEGVYIGTAPEQRADGKNPTTEPDQSNNNWIHHNTFNTQGNECVDIKESATGNIIEHNTCTGQKDTESAGLDSRGSGNTFRSNLTYGNLGAGIRLGGDTAADGTNNHVYDNIIRDNLMGGIKFQATPQGRICSNLMANNTGGNAVGTYRAQFNPTVACAPTSTASPATATTRPATATPSPAGVCVYVIDGQAHQFIESERYTTYSGRFTHQSNSARSNSLYMTIPGDGMQQDPGTVLTFELDVTEGGTFSVWLLGNGKDSASDSFFVRADAGTLIPVHLADEEWRWKEANSRITFTPGRHRISIQNREDGASVDKLLLSRKKDFTPTGLGTLALTPRCP